MGLSDLVPALLPTNSEGWIQPHNILILPGSRVMFSPLRPVGVYRDPAVAAFAYPGPFLDVLVSPKNEINTDVLFDMDRHPPLSVPICALAVRGPGAALAMTSDQRLRATVAAWLLLYPPPGVDDRLVREFRNDCLGWLAGDGFILRLNLKERGEPAPYNYSTAESVTRKIHQIIAAAEAAKTEDEVKAADVLCVSFIEPLWPKHADVVTRLIHAAADNTLSTTLESARRLGGDPMEMLVKWYIEAPAAPTAQEETP